MIRAPWVCHSVVLTLVSLFGASGLQAGLCIPSPLGNTDAVSGLIFCINTANASADDDIIDLGGAIYTLTSANNILHGNNGLPEIVGTATAGKLAIINGTIKRSTVLDTGNFRFFYVQAGAELDLYNVTLEFGAIDSGLGEGSLDITDSGGAIYNLGALDIENCVLGNNSAFLSGGALYNGGIVVEIQNSILSGNSALLDGGAIINSGDGVIEEINETTIANNTAAASGGGIQNLSTIISLSNSTLSGNSVLVSGGGIFNLSLIESISNSTFALNIAAVFGGGVNNLGTVSITNSTFSANTGTVGGGGINSSVTIPTLVSNIIAGNIGALGADILNSGTITTEGYNLVGVLSGIGIVNGVNNDIITLTPFLGPLQDNGGPTFTMALLPGSLAINNGFNLNDLPYDQRGRHYSRVVCAATDIGAYELQRCHAL